MKKVIFLSLVGLLFFACKNTKEVKAEKVEQSPADTHTQEPEAESTMWLERAKKKLPDSLYARIQRTACFGRCPIYTLSVYQSGYVEYLGEKWVEKEGRYATKVDQAVLDKLMKMAKEIQFFDLKHQYDSKYVTDLPSTITSLKEKGDFHIVVSRYEAPEKLNTFNQEFDALFKAVEWKKIPLE
ncbi:MAG: DUF6438 domain-containing protein [Vicingaceae bacterium]